MYNFNVLNVLCINVLKVLCINVINVIFRIGST